MCWTAPSDTECSSTGAVMMVVPTLSTCSIFFFSSRRRHTRFDCDWSSDVCSSDLRKAFVQDGALEQFDQLLLFAAEPAGDIGRTPDYRHRHGIDWVLHVAVGRALGLHAFDAGGRSLAGGQPINLVVHDDISQVHVP